MNEQLISNRIDQVFQEKKDILNIYFTAGFPKLDDTIQIATELQKAGADMLEIGMPFSDPVADGPTIQHSSKAALDNGMNISLLFEQLKTLRNEVEIPVLLMGYINPVLQFGIERFCDQCQEVGIDGVIIPDLPMQEYLDSYEDTFKSRNLHNIFLVTPNTSEERIRIIDEHSGGFIYLVSSSSTTGAKIDVQAGQQEYYERIGNMNLRNPLLTGFGISNKETFNAACTHTQGAIIGSAFINQLNESADASDIKKFIQAIKS